MRVCVRVFAALCSSALVVGLLPARSAAAIVFLDNEIRAEFSGFASAMTTIGDVNGDSIPDYLVGAYTQEVEKRDHEGQAFIFSGKDGKPLRTVNDPEPQAVAAFGFAVTATGDLNADGVGDFAIGAFGQKPGGQAFVFSGKDAKLLYALKPPQEQLGGGFGWALAAAGDLNGDGMVEIAVGAFAQDGTGRVFIFNGQNGTLLRTLAPPASPPGGFTFGWSVANAGDLDKDGVDDLLVGAPYTNVEKTPVQGRVYVFSGREGHLLYTLDSPQPNPGAVFGWSISASGDINKDGVPDLLVGAPYQDDGGYADVGMVFAFSGADRKLLFTLKNPAPKEYACFGLTIVPAPDVNQDQVPEILIGAPYQEVDHFYVQGEVFVFNGRDGRHLVTFDNPYGHQGSMFGYAMASPGDVNGDEIPDFAFGAPGQSIMDKAVVGRAFVFISQP